MGGRFRILVCLAVGALALLPGSALAQGGTTTSAGDQQYIDPLGHTNTTSAPSTSAPAPSPSASAAPAASTPSAGSNAPASTTNGTAGTGALPYTGLNIGLLVAIGAGLLAAGLVLRRLARRA